MPDNVLLRALNATLQLGAEESSSSSVSPLWHRKPTAFRLSKVQVPCIHAQAVYSSQERETPHVARGFSLASLSISTEDDECYTSAFDVFQTMRKKTSPLLLQRLVDPVCHDEER